MSYLDPCYTRNYEHHRNIVVILNDITSRTGLIFKKSTEFTNSNKQCIEIPCETIGGDRILLNNDNMYDGVEHTNPSYILYSGIRCRSLKNKVRHMKQRRRTKKNSKRKSKKKHRRSSLDIYK